MVLRRTPQSLLYERSNQKHLKSLYLIRSGFHNRERTDMKHSNSIFLTKFERKFMKNFDCKGIWLGTGHIPTLPHRDRQYPDAFRAAE